MLKAVCQNTLLFHSHRKITARFDGGSLTSDAGWLLFGSLDRQHRLCEGFSSCISESRDRRYVRHDLLKLIRQRVLQIVAGYEDCNDADTLRSDPMLKTVCDQLPESDPDLATQPTFSRLENSVTKKDLMRLSQWLLGRYVRSLKKRRPSKIILDLDSTDDHTHGQQEFSFYHGYYRNHILHPLLIFDADTGDLVCVVLRPGNKGAASHIVPILKRVVEAIRQGVGTDVEIEIRADSGFATPRLYEFCECEENQLQYVIGLSRNPRLQRVVEPLLDSTRLKGSLSGRKNSVSLTSFFIEPTAGIDPVASLSKWRSISAGSIVALWSPTGTISAPNHFMTTIQTEGRPRTSSRPSRII